MYILLTCNVNKHLILCNDNDNQIDDDNNNINNDYKKVQVNLPIFVFLKPCLTSEQMPVAFSVPIMFEQSVHCKELGEGLLYYLKCPMKIPSFCYDRLI